jgi:hypothetical protein
VTSISSYIGLAGEFRVMSELFLRGHNPAKSYLENGADLILENGKRIEIKSAHRANFRKKKPKKPCYLFSFRGGHRSKQIMKDFDFVICWCMDDDLFYIIPSNQINGTTVTMADTSINARHKYNSYRENWKLLD